MPAEDCPHSSSYYLQLRDATPWIVQEASATRVDVTSQPVCWSIAEGTFKCDISYEARWLGSTGWSEWSNTHTVHDVIVVPEASFELGLLFGVAALIYLWGRRNARRIRETDLDRRKRVWKR